MTDANTRQDEIRYHPDPPSTGWVIHEVFRTSETDEVMWAWCKVAVDGPGYTEIQFTQPDGHTVADAPGTSVRLGAVLFQVWC